MNGTSEITTLFGSMSLVILAIIGLLGLLIPIFLAGIYGSVRRIEKMLKQYIEVKPKRIAQEVHDSTRPYERHEGSIYPEAKNE